MTNEVSIRCQKTREVGIRRIPAYTPNAPLLLMNQNRCRSLRIAAFAELFWLLQSTCMASSDRLRAYRLAQSEAFLCVFSRACQWLVVLTAASCYVKPTVNVLRIRLQVCTYVADHWYPLFPCI